MALDAKDVEERAKQINKAATEGDPASTLLSLIEPLKGWTANEKVLRQSKIGIYVAKLRQSKDRQVAQLASTLVNKWKSDVKKGAPSGTASPATKNGTASPAPVPAPAPEKKEEKAALKAKLNVPPEKRNTVTDKVNYKVTGNDVRDACLKLMYDGLSFMSEEAPNDILRVAREVELAAYNVYQPETSPAYKSRMRSLFQNLKSKTNAGLRRDVYNGKIEPKKFVVMTANELKSDELRAIEEKMQKENMDKAMVAQEEKSISASLTCGKCGQKKVSYSQAQTRSADEPMTTFCECTVCGNRWKFS